MKEFFVTREHRYYTDRKPTIKREADHFVDVGNMREVTHYEHFKHGSYNLYTARTVELEIDGDYYHEKKRQDLTKEEYKKIINAMKKRSGIKSDQAFFKADIIEL